MHNSAGRHVRSTSIGGRLAAWELSILSLHDTGRLAFLEPILQNPNLHCEIAPFVWSAFVDDACYIVVGIK